MIRKLLLLLMVMVLVFSFAGLAAAEEGGNEASSASTETPSSQDSVGSDAGAANDSSGFSSTESASDFSSVPAETPSAVESPSEISQPFEPQSSFEPSANEADETVEIIANEEIDPAAEVPPATTADNMSYTGVSDVGSESTPAAVDIEPTTNETAATEESDSNSVDESNILESEAVLSSEAECALESGSDTPLIGGGDAELADGESLGESVPEATSYADPYYLIGKTKHGFFFGDAPDDFDGEVIASGLGGDAIQVAINYIGDNNIKPTGGLLYVESHSSDYNGFTVNAIDELGVSYFPHLVTALKGVVWDGITLEGWDPESDNRPVIAGDINIFGVSSGFTLSGFIVDGMINFSQNAGQLNLSDLDVSNPAGDEGLIVADHRGNIAIDNVNASDNAGMGAYIENWNSGNININNSTFDNNNHSQPYINHQYGAKIISRGVVTLNGVSASDNAGTGLEIYNFSKLTITNSVFNNNSNYFRLYGGGLLADSQYRSAPITLNNVYANNNEQWGIRLKTGGTANVSNTHASGNTMGGLLVFNHYGTGVANITNGSYNVNQSDETKLYEEFTWVENTEEYQLPDTDIVDGSVKILVTNDNYEIVEELVQDSDFTINLSNGLVSFINEFEPTYGDYIDIYYSIEQPDGLGLYVLSSRNVTMNSIQVNGNGVDGVVSDNRYGITWNSKIDEWVERAGSGNITLTSRAADGFAGANYLNRNGGYGLIALSNGNVTLTNTSANENGGDGIWLENGTRNVTINTNIPGWNNHFNNNAGSGVSLYTRGSVGVLNSSASGNGAYGLWTVYDDDPVLDDPEYTHDPASAINPAKALSITRGWFNDNGNNGLILFATGNIALTDVHANNNGYQGPDENYSGAFLCNGIFYYEDPDTSEVIYDYAGGNGTITVRSTDSDRYGHFDNNNGRGLFAVSNGVLNIGGVHAANNNKGDGLTLLNTLSPRAVAVSLTNIIANENYHSGIYVGSKGAITLTDVRAERNSLKGAHLVNDEGTANITIKSSNRDDWYHFSENGEDGIHILSRGVVSVSNAEASRNNDGHGLFIGIENAAGSVKSISISRGRFDDNSSSGIHVDESSNAGAITILDVDAERNNGNGLFINNSGGKGNVTIKASRATYTNHFRDNLNSGIEILTSGAVSVSNVYSSWNQGIDESYNKLTESGYGLLVDNIGAGTRGAVTIANSHFESNQNTGIKVDTLSNVSMNRVGSINNSMKDVSMGVDPANLLFYERLNDDRDGDRYWFELTGGDTYTFTLDVWGFGISYPGGFDAALELWSYDPLSGESTLHSLAYNDSSTDDPVAELTSVTLAAGVYHLRVTTPWEWVTPGSYELKVNYTDGDEITHEFYGAEINAGSGNVTVTGTPTVFSEFSGNNTNGLNIITTGNVNISNTHALNNGSIFDGGVGILVEDARAVNVLNTSRAESSWVSNNDWMGMLIYNVTGPVAVRGSIVINNNGNHGLEINTPQLAQVTVSGITAESNGFSNVGVYTLGNIILSNIKTRDTLGYGVYLDNHGTLVETDFIPGNGNITISGNNSFSDSDLEGLSVITNGVVNISGVMASNNGYHGIYIESTGVNKNMTLRNITAHYNGWDGGGDGIHAIYKSGGYGNIALTNVNSFLNVNDGIYLDANGRAISFMNSVFVANGRDGIQVRRELGWPTPSYKNVTTFRNGRNNINYTSIL